MLRTALCLLGVSLAVACGSVPPVSTGTGGTGGCPSCQAQTLQPGETRGTLQVGGVTRSYLLHVPSGYTGEAAVPLLIDFHGLLLSGQFERNLDGYADLSEREGFIVAYPDGIDNAWNIGPCCTMSRTVDDLGFARALVDKLKGEGCIDPKRVYAAGYSMGGGMSYFLACNAGDVFAAVAPAAFDLLEEMPCNPVRPITEISFRGTADSIVPYAGGASRPPNGLDTTIHFLGAGGTFEKWKTLNQCSGTPVTTGNGCQTYSQCAASAEVTLCTAAGGGHLPADAAVAWEMLKRHPMP